MYFQNAAKSIHNERLQCKNLFHFLLEQKMTLTVKTEGKFQERHQWIFGSNSHLRLKFAVLQKLNGDGQKIKVFPVSRGKTHLDVKRLLPSVVEKKTWFPEDKI